MKMIIICILGPNFLFCEVTFKRLWYVYVCIFFVPGFFGGLKWYIRSFLSLLKPFSYWFQLYSTSLILSRLGGWLHNAVIRLSSASTEVWLKLAIWSWTWQYCKYQPFGLKFNRFYFQLIQPATQTPTKTRLFLDK